MSDTKTVSLEQVKLAGVLLKQEHEARLLLEKEAHVAAQEKKAMKIAFREIELGVSEPFKTFEEFHEKVASLMQEDLDVVEKALERGYRGASARTGVLADDSANGGSGLGNNPFGRWVLTGELD